ncbi:MAG: acyl-CoA dehydrogenase family protein [Deltaproteobacteria bacterium]|nr:acyl-CoA dehydrogenase family protein [Deltaproteobacteria bacterium]
MRVYTLQDDQVALVDAVREFCLDRLAPVAAADDANEHFRMDLFRAMGEQGFCGIPTPEAYGGLGLGYMEYALVLEEIARHSAAWAVTVAVTGLPQIILRTYGDEAQRERWMPGLASGEILGAFALSEPGSGSDAAALKTTAVRDGDDYVLNGTKFWITSGGVADLYVVMARTGGPGAGGISAFLVPAGTPGLSFGRKEEKMGLRSSPTAEVILEDVRVPATHRIGPEGVGFKVALSALDSGRITIAAISVGLSAVATAYAARYATEREQFNTAIIDFQGVGFLLADMATRTDAARLLVHRAASLRDAGLPYALEAAMAKVNATDTAMAVTTDAVQVMGGYGYTREHPLERYMRDAKVMQIVEGTNQIQRLVIARHLKKRYTER